MSASEKPRQPATACRLTPKQQAAALALAGGRTVAEAARDAKAGERTVYTWLTQEGFAARVAAMRSEMVSRALGVMADGMVGAGATLRWLSIHAKSEMARLGAARCVIELGVKLRESVELEGRIKALEEQAGRQALEAGAPLNGRSTGWPQ